MTQTAPPARSGTQLPEACRTSRESRTVTIGRRLATLIHILALPLRLLTGLADLIVSFAILGAVLVALGLYSHTIPEEAARYVLDAVGKATLAVVHHQGVF